jgi:predicted  nucleic acid-binding Zn-ribbon protein
VNELLIQLQEVDTQIDQLTHRKGALPELATAQQHRQHLLKWESQRQQIDTRTSELEAAVEAAEQQAAELDMHKLRLSGQLKTVIAPREAEALQSEMRTLADRRDALDELELEAMEELSELEIHMAQLCDNEGSLRTELESAEAALELAQAEIAAQVQTLEAQRSELRLMVPAEILARYDHLRSHLGVAVARLNGSRCEGCHMDLSPVEVDIVKAVPVTELAECPQCTRILVRRAQ